MLVVVVIVALMAVLLAACDHKVSAASDEYMCVFDGSQSGGQKLKAQVPPTQHTTVDDNDVQVRIPSSNRFFMATADDSLRDPLAPTGYQANAKGNVPIVVAGQVRFRFNLNKACEWYSKHGRRNADENGDLGFNLRGGDANNAGWFHFLAENFGLTMQSIARPVTSQYDWAAMYYDYPSNATDAGNVPKGDQPAEPTSLKLGRDLGKAFTTQLKANLGGDYFCGIDPDPDGANTDCPPMLFQVKGVAPDNQKLVQSRTKVEATRQELESTRLEGDLQRAQAQQVQADEAAKQQILAAQLKTAQIQAQIDNQKCLQLAAVGLDCEGKRPQPIVVGGATGQ